MPAKSQLGKCKQLQHTIKYLDLPRPRCIMVHLDHYRSIWMMFHEFPTSTWTFPQHFHRGRSLDTIQRQLFGFLSPSGKLDRQTAWLKERNAEHIQKSRLFMIFLWILGVSCAFSDPSEPMFRTNQYWIQDLKIMWWHVVTDGDWWKANSFEVSHCQASMVTKRLAVLEKSYEILAQVWS